MSMDVVQNVVQMVFDNGSFERNAGATLQTLAKLKEALKFEEAVRGIDAIRGSLKDTGINAFYDGVYKVQGGFNALDVIATRVLQNITDKVQAVGTNLVKQITVAPLKSGLEEYNTQINAIQTILANTNDALIEKGFTTEHDRIEKVNGVLDELNHYADMTIYNFTEMTRNIGTFTAAGVELDTAATSIKGIANLAAMSGSNSQQASTAMYQLSQAIAAGSVKLQDWNSVVNAGMGGKLFQKELIDTAKAMGVTDAQFQNLVNGATTFRESLSSGWISAEVLTNTLEKFTAGSEGYTKSQVEQMRKLWEARGYSKTMIDEMTSSLTVLNDEQEKNLRTKWAEKGFSDEQIDHVLSMGAAATDAATKVKTLNQLIDTVKEALQSGWTQSWEYIIGDFEQAKRLWTEISDILNMYIGKSADSRNAVLKEWSEAAYSYNEAGELIYAADGKVVEGGKMVADEMGGRELVIQGLRNSFQGLMEVVVYFRRIWEKTFVKGDFGDGKVRKELTITGETLKKVSRQFHDFTDSFKKSFGTADNPSKLLKDLGGAFTYFATAARHSFDGISNVFSSLGNIFKALFKSDAFSTQTFYDIAMAVNMVAKMFDSFGQALHKNFVGSAETAAKNLDELTRFFNGLFSVFENAKLAQLDAFYYGFQSLGKVFEHLIGPGETIATLLGKVGDRLSTFGNALGDLFYNEDVSNFEGLFDSIATAFNNFIDTVKESVDFSGFSKLFSNIIEVMTSDKINLFGTFADAFEGLFNILKAFIGIASPIAAALADVFGDWIFNAAHGLDTIADRFKSFTQSLIPNAEVMTGLQNLFEGIFRIITAVADVVGNVLVAAWDGLIEIVSSFLPDGKTFADTLNDWGDKLTDVSKIIETLVSGDNGVPKLSDIIGRITDKFIDFFGSLKDINLLEKLSTLFGAIGKGIKHALGGTEDMTLLDTITNGIENFLVRLREIFSGENGELDFVKIFEAGGIGVVIKKLVDLFKQLKEGTGDFKGFLGVFKQIGDAFEELSESLGEKFKAESIKVIANAILEMAAALFIISMIEPVTLAMSIAAVAGMFDLIDTLLASLKTFNKSDAAVLASIAGVIQTMGNSILMMAAAIAIIGNMKIENVVQGLIAIALMMQMMTQVVEHLSKIEGSLPKVAGALIGLAIALNLLIIPIKILGGMDLPSLAKGLVAVAAMMASLVGAAAELSKWGSSFKPSMALGFIMMAESIKILSSAVVMVKDIPWPDLAKGLAVMAVALIGMVSATAVIAKAHLGDDIMTLGTSLLMLGASMMMLTESAKGLAGISWPDLGKFAAVLAGALIALGLAAAVINGPNLFLIGSGLLMIAKAITLLTIALNAAQILTPIAVGIGSALQGITNSLTAFAHHAASEAFLQFLQDAILFLPKLGIALAKTLIEMVATLGQGATQVVSSIVAIVKAILAGITQVLPDVFTMLQTLFTQIGQLIIAELPVLFQVFTTFWDQFFAFLTGQIPNLYNLLSTLFTAILMFIQTQGPMLISTVTTLFAAFLVQLQTLIPLITNVGLNIITSFLGAVASRIGDIVTLGVSICVNFIDGVASSIGSIIDSAFNLIISFINGLAEAIDNNYEALNAAVLKLITSIVNAITGSLASIAGAGSKVVTKFASSITSGANRVFSAASSLAKNIASGLRNGIGNLYNIGADAINGFVNGIRSKIGSVISAAADAAGALVNRTKGALKEASPSKVMHAIGAFASEGLANGVEAAASLVDRSAKKVVSMVISTMSEVKDIDAEPTITPVLNTDGMSFKSFNEELSLGMSKLDNFAIQIPNYSRDIVDGLNKSIDSNAAMMEQMATSLIDYDRLGVAVVNAMIDSGVHVRMDSGEFVGYLAGEINDVRRMYRG